jgi:hypothetical protein
MMLRYAICSERHGKPVTRAVVDSRPDADKLLERLRQIDSSAPESAYWIAELGSECDAWRWLVPEESSPAS